MKSRTSHGAFGIALLAITMLSVPRNAWSVNSDLEKARQAYQALDYDEVTPLLKSALDVATTPEEEAEIYAFLAVMHVTYGREKKARRAFQQVLKRQPDYVLSPESSPKIVSAFEAARAKIDAANQKELIRATSTETPKAASNVEEENGNATDPDQMMSLINPASPAVYERWWFWAALGATVIGGSAVLVWGTTRETERPQTDFGPYRLP